MVRLRENSPRSEQIQELFVLSLQSHLRSVTTVPFSTPGGSVAAHYEVSYHK